MKYIETYEKYFPDLYDGEFYYIPYNKLNLIFIAIDKINTTEENKSIIKRGIQQVNVDQIKKIIGVFVGFTDNINALYTKEQDFYICMDENDKQEGFQDYTNDKNIKYKYKGEIKLEGYEIAANKYNL